MIYYFRNEQMPVFMLAAYGKNEKANLSKAEWNAVARAVPMLIENYSRKSARKP